MLPSDVTCQLCGELYRDPLMLPCLHSFCKECLVTHTETQDAIVCPTCNEVSSKPVYAIPQNLWLKELAEKEIQKQKFLTSPKCERCTRNSAATCWCCSCNQLLCSKCANDHRFSRATTSHDLMDLAQAKEVGNQSVCQGIAMSAQCSFPNHDQLKYFCEDCEALVCGDCIVSSHVGHECCYYGDVAEKGCGGLQDSLQGCAEVVTALEDAIENGESMIKLIQARKKEIDKEIDDTFNALEVALVNRRKALLQESNQLAISKTTAINIQLEAFRILRDKVSFASKFCSSVVESQGACELLSVKKTTEERLESLKKDFKELSCDLIENESMPTSLDHSSLDDEISRFGKICGLDLEPSLCGIETGIAVPLATVEKKREFTVSLKDRLGGQAKGRAPMVAHLSKCNDREATTEVTISEEDQRTLTCTPDTVGEYELSVKVRGIHIKNSPYRMWVRQERDFRSEANITVYEVGAKVRGVAVHSNGDVFATCDDGYIQVFDNNGTEKSQIGVQGNGEGEFEDPWGIVLVGDIMYVVDGCNARVQKLTISGEYIGQFGGEESSCSDGSVDDVDSDDSDGSDDSNDFDGSGDSNITDDGADSVGSGDYDTEVLEVPSGSTCDDDDDDDDAKLSSPRGIAYDGADHVLVADGGKVKVFTLDGTFVQSINCYSHPVQICDVAVDNDGNIHVPCFDEDIVQVFSSDGTKLYQYGDNYEAIAGAAVDENGYRYITSHDSNSLLILDATGNLINELACSLSEPYSVTIDTKGHIYVADGDNNRIIKIQ